MEMDVVVIVYNVRGISECVYDDMDFDEASNKGGPESICFPRFG